MKKRKHKSLSIIFDFDEGEEDDFMLSRMEMRFRVDPSTLIGNEFPLNFP